MAESIEAVTNTSSTLSYSIRRYVMDYLAEQETPVSFDRLVTRVAACTPTASAESQSPKSRPNVK